MSVTNNKYTHFCGTLSCVLYNLVALYFNNDDDNSNGHRNARVIERVVERQTSAYCSREPEEVLGP
jgi:hypothetical protein